MIERTSIQPSGDTQNLSDHRSSLPLSSSSLDDSLPFDATLPKSLPLSSEEVVELFRRDETLKLFTILTEKGIHPAIQIYAALVSEHDYLVDMTPTTIEQRIEFAEILGKKGSIEHESKSFSSMGYATHRLLGEIVDADVKIAHLYLEVLYGSTKEAVLRLLGDDRPPLSHLDSINYISESDQLQKLRLYEQMPTGPCEEKVRGYCYMPGRIIRVPCFQENLYLQDSLCTETGRYRVNHPTSRTVIELDKGYVEAHNPPTVREWLSTQVVRFGNFVDKAVFATQLGLAIVRNFGGIHPVKKNGEWVVVLESWADYEHDPRDYYEKFFGEENKYHASFLEYASKNLGSIDPVDIDVARPFVRIYGFGSLQLLEHHRIEAAHHLKRGIVVSLTNRFETFF